MQFIKEKYWEYEYEEVVTPNIYNFDLWKTSGHSDHYKQNMFHFDIEKQEFGLKPMNCPGKYSFYPSTLPFGGLTGPGGPAQYTHQHRQPSTSFLLWAW